MSKKKLIVNADDFGQSEGVNKGIIRAHENGIVTSTSLMVRYPAAAYAAAYSKQNSSLGFGLHIDLGEWICKDGTWEALYEVVSLKDPAAIKDEITKQLDLFYSIMGHKPTHIDSHQHVHQNEIIRPILTEIAGELNVVVRGYGDQIKYCGDFYGQLEDGSSYHTAISVEGLKKIIERLPEAVTEMACHPGLDDDLETMYRVEREIEMRTLCDNSIKQQIADSDIELISFENFSFFNN